MDPRQIPLAWRINSSVFSEVFLEEPENCEAEWYFRYHSEESPEVNPWEPLTIEGYQDLDKYIIRITDALMETDDYKLLGDPSKLKKNKNMKKLNNQLMVMFKTILYNMNAQGEGEDEYNQELQADIESLQLSVNEFALAAHAMKDVKQGMFEGKFLNTSFIILTWLV